MTWSGGRPSTRVVWQARCKLSQRFVVGMVLSVVVLEGRSAWAAPDAERGKTLYMESCQHCHGARGDGKSEMAAYLTPPPSNLTAKVTQEKSDAVLRKTILEGRPGTAMSGFGGAFTEAQVADMLAYLRSLKP